jgi:tetratricopeptide (TPR) repeat protein
MDALHSAPDSPARVDELNALAYRWRHDDTRRALVFARQALVLAEQLAFPPGRAWALLRVALCEYILADAARQYESRLGQAIALMRELADRPGEAEAMNLLANILGTRGEHEAALELHGRCLALRRGFGQAPAIAISLNNMGVELLKLARTGEALACLRESLQLALAQTDLSGIAYAHVNLGQVYLELDDPGTAVEHFEQAFARVARTEDRALECSALTGLARARALQGAHDAALELLQHAQALALRTGNVGDQAQVNLAQAAVEQGRGRHAAATAHLHAALASAQRADNRALESEVLVRLAHSQWRLGDADAAQARLARALEVAAATGQVLVAESARRMQGEIGRAA